MSLELWVGCGFLTLLTICIIIENLGTMNWCPCYDLLWPKAVSAASGAVFFTAAATGSLTVAVCLGFCLFLILWFIYDNVA